MRLWRKIVRHLSVKKTWLPFEHRVYRVVKELQLSDQTLILGVSGGADSMALLSVFAHIAPALRTKVCVAHFHHGVGRGDESQSAFRNRAQRFVARAARGYGLRFITNKPRFESRPLSEASLRERRYRFFKKVALRIENPSWILTAHHSQDLLETRLIHLLRGCGAVGFGGLKLRNSERRLLRPFLDLHPHDLREYLRARKVEGLSDPSNQQTRALRNWLRLCWLPQLERFQAGATGVLARSLALLSDELSGVVAPREEFVNGELDRRRLLSLEKAEQARIVAAFLHHHKMQAYTKAHVEEVLKRLDTPRKRFKFALLKHRWIADAERVRVSRVGTASRQSI